MQQHVQVLKEILGKKAVAFYPVFAKALSSIPAAVMLSQGYFWQETAKYKELVEIDGELFFTATADEWFEETAVTLEQQMKARDILKKSGIWIEDKCGIPARLYYRIDFEQLVLFIAKYLESRKQGLGKAQNKELAKPKTVDGENPKQDVGFPQNYIIDDESFFESLESSIVANAPTENQTVFSVEIFEPSKTEILTLETENTKKKKAPAARRAKLPTLQPYQSELTGDPVDLATEWMQGNAEQVKIWQERAGTQFDNKRLKEEAVKYFAYYQAKHGPDHMANTRPMYFFQRSFGGWLMSAKHYNTPFSTGTPKKQAVNDARGIDYSRPQKF